MRCTSTTHSPCAPDFASPSAQDLLSKLKFEMEAQLKHVTEVKARINRDKATLFSRLTGVRWAGRG